MRLSLLFTCAGELITKANGDTSDKTGRPIDDGQIGIIDINQRMIGLHMYDGLFKVRLAAHGGRSAWTKDRLG